jgi:hypothetical protein
MTPPRWTDEHGQPCPTRPCGKCGRVIPVNRWPVQTLPTVKRWPYQVVTFVKWCGHQQEVELGARGRRVVRGDPGGRGGAGATVGQRPSVASYVTMVGARGRGGLKP